MSWILRPSLGSSTTLFGHDRKRVATEMLLGLALLAALILLVMKPIHQPADYHHFQDARAVFGVPNLMNVLSNVPFVLVGFGGLWWLATGRHDLPTALRNAYAVMMAGIFMTGFGSAWYHWSPTDEAPVWDRLPMVIAFVGFTTAMLGERLSLDAAKWTLGPLLAYGVGSVLYWHAFDDLRRYVMVQYVPLLAIPLMLWWLPPAYSRSSDIVIALGLYILAKAFEAEDGLVYGFGHLVSGHTIKHLTAAAAAYCLLQMLQRRRRLPDYGSSSTSQYR